MKNLLPVGSGVLLLIAVSSLVPACETSTAKDGAEGESVGEASDGAGGVSGDGTCDVSRADPPRGDCAPWFTLNKHSELSADERYRVNFIASGDLNDDGLLDVVMTEPLSVLANKGELIFEEVPLSGGIKSTATAAGLADLDNDGDLDLLTTGSNWIEIFRNVGAFEFELMHTGTGSESQATHILFADLNSDSFLDVFLSYPPASAPGRPEVPPVLLMGDGGNSFSRVGEEYLALYPTYAWSASLFDADADGGSDIFVAADGGIEDFGFEQRDSSGRSKNENRVFRVSEQNCAGGGGCNSDGFTLDETLSVVEDASSYGLEGPHSSMGGLVEDFDGDGRLDLFVTDFGRNKLYLRGENGFVESAVKMGFGASHRENAECSDGDDNIECLLVAWSALFQDFNLDGENDVLVLNHTEKGVTEQPPQLYQRDRTEDTATPYVEYSLGLGDLAATAAIPGDFDGDGDLDVLVTIHRGVPVLLENTIEDAGELVTVHLQGTSTNRSGIGAVVFFEMKSGAFVTRMMGAGGITRASLPAEVHVGLKAGDSIESITVTWPGGQQTKVSEIEGRTIEIIEE